MRSFVVREAVLALKPINDTELLSVSWTLPAGFGYLLAEAHLNIVQDRAADWEGEGYLLLANSSQANNNYDYKMPLQFRNMSNGGVSLDLRASRNNAGTLTRTPVVPGSLGTLTSFRFSNLSATAAAAGVVNALCSFWEYDLEQLAWFPTHSATNVVGR